MWYFDNAQMKVVCCCSVSLSCHGSHGAKETDGSEEGTNEAHGGSVRFRCLQIVTRERQNAE